MLTVTVPALLHASLVQLESIRKAQDKLYATTALPANMAGILQQALLRNAPTVQPIRIQTQEAGSGMPANVTPVSRLRTVLQHKEKKKTCVPNAPLVLTIPIPTRQHAPIAPRASFPPQQELLLKARATHVRTDIMP